MTLLAHHFNPNCQNQVGIQRPRFLRSPQRFQSPTFTKTSKLNSLCTQSGSKWPVTTGATVMCLIKINWIKVLIHHWNLVWILSRVRVGSRSRWHWQRRRLICTIIIIRLKSKWQSSANHKPAVLAAPMPFLMQLNLKLKTQQFNRVKAVTPMNPPSSVAAP